METAVSGLLSSIKNRHNHHAALSRLMEVAAQGDYVFKVKVISEDMCFVCDRKLGSEEVALLCGHRLCSPSCFTSYLQSQGERMAVCRHCLEPVMQVEETKSLLDYSNRPKHKPKFTCDICTDEYLVESSITLECDHRFCIDCITSHVENLLDEGKVESSQVKCPKQECPCEISYNEAKNLLNPAQFERLDKLMATKSLPNFGEDVLV